MRRAGGAQSHPPYVGFFLHKNDCMVLILINLFKTKGIKRRGC